MKCMYIRSLTYSEILETCNFESLVNHLRGNACDLFVTAVLRALWAICNIVSGDQEQMLGNVDPQWVGEEISFDMFGWVY